MMSATNPSPRRSGRDSTPSSSARRVLADARRIIWRPQAGPQSAFVKCPVFEVCYGGARGGGKTDAALGEWAIHAKTYGEHAKGLFIRRTLIAVHGGEKTIQWSACVCAGAGGVKVGHWIG